MKKILFVALAAVGLTACVQNEELAISKSNAITFDNVYVGNATKAAIDGSYTSAKGNLDHFNVWATISNTNGTANIFENEAVTKNNAGVWSYAVENTQYWIPGNNYSFVGVVDGDVVVDANACNMPLTIATSLSNQKDVLYATQSRSYNGETVTPVHFDFEHLLAKVKFTAKNTVTTQYSELYYTVESIVITNADNEAVYSIANGTWTPSSTYTAEFGAVTTSNDAGAAASNLAYGQNAESNYELLVLPQENKSLNIKVNYTLHKDKWYQTYEKELTAANLNIEKGRAYNFVLELGNPGAPIDFTAEVEDWIDAIPSIDNTFAVATAEDLATIAEMVEAGEDFTGKTVTLVGDIDLSATTRNAVASNWTPIGTSDKPFTGAFDGNGYTIKNLALVEPEAKEGKAYMGFFGYAKNATIKNVTFENVYINIPCLDIDHSQGHIGAVAGSLEGTSTIENVTVKGAVQIYTTQDANGASRVAVIAGGNSYGNVTMKNVHVVANEGSYLKANNNTGALAGQLQGKMVFENCSSNIDVTVNKFFAGGLVGIAAGDSYFKNCHTTGNVAVVAGRAGRHNDEYRVGGIAGGWADGATKVCTLENCSYTGTVSGLNADGAVAEPLDYMGYVGRGYTLANCEGSTVIIDGVKFVQVGNAAPYGNYDITTTDGNTVITVSTVEELNNLNATDAYVILSADIDFQGAAMTKPIQLWKNSTFNGMGHKISNVKTAVQGGYATSLFRGDANPGNKVVKNLVIENLSTPAGYSFAAAIWSDLQGANIEIDNVHINNSAIAADGTIGGFVGFVSGSTTSVIIKNSSINNTNLNGGEADKKRGAVVGRAYGCAVTCENVVVENVKINDVAATTSTLVGDKGYTGTVTVK